MKQLGTLGGGNHFIEVCLDTHDHVWLMLHSGSSLPLQKFRSKEKGRRLLLVLLFES
jgi:hypothetical protein